jgi:hypothetical protein
MRTGHGSGTCSTRSPRRTVDHHEAFGSCHGAVSPYQRGVSGGGGTSNFAWRVWLLPKKGAQLNPETPVSADRKGTAREEQHVQQIDGEVE